MARPLHPASAFPGCPNPLKAFITPVAPEWRNSHQGTNMPPLDRTSGRPGPAAPATPPHLRTRLQDLDRFWHPQDRAVHPAPAHPLRPAEPPASLLTHLPACNELGAALREHQEQQGRVTLRLGSEDADDPPAGSVQLDKVPSRAPRTLFHLQEYGFPSDLWAYRDGKNIRFVAAAYHSFLGITLLFDWTCHRLKDGELAWYRMPPKQERLYALDRLLTAPGQPVVFCLDETSLAAAERAFPKRIATTGRLRCDKVAGHLSPLSNRDVIIMAGRKRPCLADVRQLRDLLRDIGCTVSDDVLPVPRHRPRKASRPPQAALAKLPS
ncbi:hypothetical protein [Cereibacter azotoformans]|nr:hypothetical protein [Cereibacter azotoformans]